MHLMDVRQELSVFKKKSNEFIYIYIYGIYDQKMRILQ